MTLEELRRDRRKAVELMKIAPLVITDQDGNKRFTVYLPPGAK